MYEKNLVKVIFLSIWVFFLILYFVITLVISPLAEHYKYYKIQKDTAIWVAEYVKERTENPEKYGMIDTTNVNLSSMFNTVKCDYTVLDLSQYDIREIGYRNSKTVK